MPLLQCICHTHLIHYLPLFLHEHASPGISCRQQPRSLWCHCFDWQDAALWSWVQRGKRQTGASTSVPNKWTSSKEPTCQSNWARSVYVDFDIAISFFDTSSYWKGLWAGVDWNLTVTKGAHQNFGGISYLYIVKMDCLTPSPVHLYSWISPFQWGKGNSLVKIDNFTPFPCPWGGFSLYAVYAGVPFWRVGFRRFCLT